MGSGSLVLCCSGYFFLITIGYSPVLSLSAPLRRKSASPSFEKPELRLSQESSSSATSHRPPSYLPDPKPPPQRKHLRPHPRSRHDSRWVWSSPPFKVYNYITVAVAYIASAAATTGPGTGGTTANNKHRPACDADAAMSGSAYGSSGILGGGHSGSSGDGSERK